MNDTLSDRGRFAVLCYEAITRAGYDANTFLAHCGYCAEQFKQPDFSYPHEQVIPFWRALESFTRNPDIGFTVGQHLPSTRGSVLSYLFLGAPNFGDALQTSFKYVRLLSDALSVSLHNLGDVSYIHLQSSVADVNAYRHYTECLMSGFIAFYRDVTNQAFKPTRIDFVCDAPANDHERASLYGCHLQFGCRENRIYFDSSVLACCCGYADPELMLLHENYARHALRKLEEQDFLVKVRAVISTLLERGEVTLEVASRALGLNATELKYRLSSLGTHFIREREKCRQRVVKEMLRKSSESITQIAFTAGFSEPSTFYRAFKRWTHGETPADFRARHQR